MLKKTTIAAMLLALARVFADDLPAARPDLRNIKFSSDCASNTWSAGDANVDFPLFNISTVTPVAGHGVCEAVLEYENWPVGYAMAITDATLRGHLKLPKATKLYRFKTTVFTTFPVSTNGLSN